MHTHTTAGMAVAATTDGIKCHDFAGISLHNRVAYHEFEGITVDLDERARLSKNLGDKNVMILRNHGLLSCGRTVADAFRYLYALETACQVQIMAQSSGQTLTLPSHEVREKHAQTLEDADNGELAFSALVRLMDQKDPSFRN
jgi:ribulose-5-phosphate 4-epimerase/fuculose-1-phosphate aldolase